MMVSLRVAGNEERPLSVRIDQRLPSDWIRARWGRTGVIPGESHSERSATRRLKKLCSSLPVITVHSHPLCHRHAEGFEDRGERSRYSPNVRLELPNVVNEGGRDRFGVIGKGCGDTPSNIDGVPLVRRALGPEQLSAPAVEVIVHEPLIIGSGSLGSEMSKESADEVADLVDPTCHEAACLHLMQRRAAGRYSMRSAPMRVPQVSQMP